MYIDRKIHTDIHTHYIRTNALTRMDQHTQYTHARTHARKHSRARAHTGQGKLQELLSTKDTMIKEFDRQTYTTTLERIGGMNVYV